MHFGWSNLLFCIILALSIAFFVRNVGRLFANLKMGKPLARNDNIRARFLSMARVALGQSKMVKRPIAGVLHIFVYLGFLIINLEVIEILVDGLFGTHRFLSPILGKAYGGFTATLEVLALLVIVGVVAFYIRRNGLRLPRFQKPEMKGWPKIDGNLILIVEIVLMLLFLSINAADGLLHQRAFDHYAYVKGNFLISDLIIAPLYKHLSTNALWVVERTSWWFHIIGILLFLNYLYYSKHLHIILAFPNTYFANLEAKGKFTNLEAVTKEVALMLDPNADPYTAHNQTETPEDSSRFGAKDVTDLSWVQLLNAYTCTECGRCTDSCPANITGKKLSPRKIMMDVRDRTEEIGRIYRAQKRKKAKQDDDEILNRGLLDNLISQEEIWACTTCNACVEACPVLIDPLSIIMDLRRFSVMEASRAPQELNMMMTNVENNAAPWQFNQADRLNWTDG